MSILCIGLALTACGDDSRTAKDPDNIVDSGNALDMATIPNTPDTSSDADVTMDSRVDSAVVQDQGNGTDSQTDAATENPCIRPLVKLRTGPSNTCSGGNEHHWPLGLAPTDCHGWVATDPMGRQHNNSANDIRCNADGAFQFTQFAGNTDCSGTGVTKVYQLNMCQQDIPPRLHTIAFDLTCCANPQSADCVSGLPLITVPGGMTLLNGTTCRE